MVRNQITQAFDPRNSQLLRSLRIERGWIPDDEVSIPSAAGATVVSGCLEQASKSLVQGISIVETVV